jgi:hypothetical protein
VEGGRGCVGVCVFVQVEVAGFCLLEERGCHVEMLRWYGMIMIMVWYILCTIVTIVRLEFDELTTEKSKQQMQ